MRRKVGGKTGNTALARHCIHRFVCWDVRGATKTLLLWDFWLLRAGDFLTFGVEGLEHSLLVCVCPQVWSGIFKYGNTDGDKHDFTRNVHGCK